MAIGKLPSDDNGDDEGGGGIFAEINITPLTDVVFVLLIIFMAYAVSAVTQERREKKEIVQQNRSGHKINLPEGAAKEIDVTSNSVVVGIVADGKLLVNGQEVTETELDQYFLQAFAADKATQVVLKADGGVPHRRVVGVMERAKRAGLTRLAIATKGN